MITMILQVKALLEENGCIAAWWLGNLKHRTVRGDEVSSQIPEPEAEVCAPHLKYSEYA